MFVFTKTSEAIIASSENAHETLTPLIPLASQSFNSNINGIPGSPATTISGFSSSQINNRRLQTHHNQLGTINGCYVPCLLNIMGIVLFERLGWGIGQVGIRNVLLIYLFAELAAILTVLSLSAIVTNGNMKGGGSYYMISRTLGAEFGGSVGILFYCAYAVNIAFCCSGCAEEIIKTWYQNDKYLSDWQLNLIFSSSILFGCFGVALMGARIFTKVNVFLFMIIFISVVLAILAGFSRPQFVLHDYQQSKYIHQAWNVEQLKANWINHCPNCFTVHMVFGVLFSGVTGLMEGANLSGDLANPEKSIPTGTLSAICTAITVYLFMIVSFGGSFDSNILRAVTTIPQNVSWGYIGYYLSILGVLISSSSSALGSLFGGSRVLQAIARDRIFPGIFNILGYGTVVGDEPMIAVIATWLFAQCLLFIGGINAIAPIATSFFCLSYLTVNLCCFLLCISGQTNFRPLFKYYSKWTALLGLIMNIFIMFYVDFKFASISLFCAFCIFIYLIYRNAKTKNNWGDVGSSVIFHQLRKYLLKLNTKNIDGHSKLWRPHILLLVDNHQLSLIDFCNNLKKGGLYIIGVCIEGEFGDFDQTINIRNNWIEFIDTNGLKAFPQINIAPNIRNGLENLILLSGLGALQANTIVLPLIRIHKKENNHNKIEEKEEEEEEEESIVIHDDTEQEENIINKNGNKLKYNLFLFGDENINNKNGCNNLSQLMDEEEEYEEEENGDNIAQLPEGTIQSIQEAQNNNNNNSKYNKIILIMVLMIGGILMMEMNKHKYKHKYKHNKMIIKVGIHLLLIHHNNNNNNNNSKYNKIILIMVLMIGGILMMEMNKHKYKHKYKHNKMIIKVGIHLLLIHHNNNNNNNSKYNKIILIMVLMIGGILMMEMNKHKYKHKYKHNKMIIKVGIHLLLIHHNNNNNNNNN
eukprot:193328_1